MVVVIPVPAADAHADVAVDVAESIPYFSFWRYLWLTVINFLCFLNRTTVVIMQKNINKNAVANITGEGVGVVAAVEVAVIGSTSETTVEWQITSTT